jgi:hypothetical protein
MIKIAFVKLTEKTYPLYPTYPRQTIWPDRDRG